MSVRDTILANLKTGLESISSVKYVTRDLQEYPSKLKQWSPALFIADDGGEEINNYCDGDKAQITILILIYGYYHRAEDMTAGFSTFLEAVVDKIYAPISLGSNVRDCTVVSVNPIVSIPKENATEFEMHLQIKYWRALGGA